jgi:hypothetical protein
MVGGRRHEPPTRCSTAVSIEDVRGALEPQAKWVADSVRAEDAVATLSASLLGEVR